MRLKMTITIPRIGAFFIVTTSMTAMSDTTVIEDGFSKQEAGIFRAGCYYGKSESLSDHAPVIYGNFGTWNVASPISHFKIIVDKNKPEEFFFNHKFFANDKGELIDRSGASVGLLTGSEVVLLKQANNKEKLRERLHGQNSDYDKEASTLTRQIENAYRVLEKDLDGEEDNAEREEKISALKALRDGAIEEIKNKDETSFAKTLEILKATERGYAGVTKAYIDRFGQIITKINEMFQKDKDLKYLVLQEVPSSFDKTIDGEHIQSAITEIFNPQKSPTEILRSIFHAARPTKLSIAFFDAKAGEKLTTKIGATNYKKNFLPDVAIVYRDNNSPLTQEAYDSDNRFVSWCRKDDNACFVSAHMPYTVTDDELAMRCEDINNLANTLMSKGYDNINIAGDFNTYASRIAEVCKTQLNLPDANVVLRTVAGEKPNSCSSNSGDLSAYNIDIAITYERKIEQQE